MTVVRAEVTTLRVALRRPLATSHGSITDREGFLLRLTAEDGTSGVGEAAPAYWIGEGSLATTADDLRRVVARVYPKADAAALRAWLDGEEGGPLSAAAACALDVALLDLEARRRALPAAVVLGGTVAALPVAALVGGRDATELRAAVDEARTRGFTTLKLKVGGGPLADDVARLRLVRTAAGAAIALRLDANGAWTPDEAVRALAAFAPFDVAFVEEPIRAADPWTLAALARSAVVGVAVDESIAGLADLERLFAAEARVSVVLKAARVGGPTRLVALARRAHAAGLAVIVTDAIESVVGTGVAAHAAAAVPASGGAVGLGGMQLTLDGGDRSPWVMPAGPGFALVPCEAPGVGALHG